MLKPLTVCITTNCGKVLKRWEYQATLPVLRNPYAGQEATVRTRNGTTDWLKIGKGVYQGCILSTCLFNFYAEYMMQNPELDESQAGIKISGRDMNNLRYVDDTTLMAEREELKSLLITVKVESEKAGLNIKKKLGSWHLISSLHGKEEEDRTN